MASSPPGPIHGYVPSDPPSDANKPPKPKLPNRKGWPKGKPRKHGLVAMPKEGERGCPACGRAVAELTMPTVLELIRIMRDKLQDDPDVQTDVFYLAARADGYCSLTCWRKA